MVAEANASCQASFREVRGLGNPHPLISAVRGFPHPRADASFGEVVRPPGAVPRRREQVVGIVAVRNHVHKAHEFSFGGRGHGEHGRPVFPAVFRSIDGSATVGRVQFAQSGHPHAVRVGRVDDDPSNVVAAFESGMSPRGPMVVAEVHPVASVGTPGGIHFA